MIVCSFCLFFQCLSWEIARLFSSTAMSDNKPNWLCQCGELWSQQPVSEAINLFFSYWPIRLCWVLANSLYVVHNIIYNEKKGNWLIKSWCLISILECFYLLIKALCNVPQFLLLSILRSGFCFCCGSLQSTYDFHGPTLPYHEWTNEVYNSNVWWHRFVFG